MLSQQQTQDPWDLLALSLCPGAVVVVMPTSGFLHDFHAAFLISFPLLTVNF